MTSYPTRREFVRTASSGLAGLGAASKLVMPGDSLAEASKSTVAVIRDEKAISDRNVTNRAELRRMVDTALGTVTGKAAAKEAWAALGVTKDDVVAIKVNCNSWTFLLSTHPDLVYALTDSLSEVVPANNIIIYERYTNELGRAGYRTNTGPSGVRCFGAEKGGGFDSGGLTKIVTDMATKVINIPSLKAVDGDFGASLFLKNHIGTIPPNQMANCHGNALFCNQVCAQPALRNKAVLAVCDGLRGTYKRGVPWYWKGIIMSRDQVAAEYTAHQVINEKRIAEKDRPIGLPSYVTKADTAYRLGTADPAMIDVVKKEL
ncbi:MAG: DUF362 domain-containing protein [Candidatus Latescibacteria bacterium]|nr:DUF362 domain-containing protein [Candidatus Latescibacterota bacterium]